MASFNEGGDRVSADDNSLLSQNVEYPNYQRLQLTQEGNLLWDEYKYRHDLIWRHLIRSTLALVALVTVRYSTAFNATDSFVTFAWIVAFGYWWVTLFAIEPELRLYTKIKHLHRMRQDYCFGLVNDITPIKGKLKPGKIFFVDPFARRVGVYLLLLLLATLLAIPEKLSL
jgi:hypothetical protein